MPGELKPVPAATPQTPVCPLALSQNLIEMLQELSHARTLDTVIDLVRERARDFTHADGVTFVLKDGGHCHYVDENAIGPLWKGRRFPLSTCISGWAMAHKQAVAIEDIYQDERIPLDAYRVTFIKSLAMVPIRRSNPIGAIGFYWSQQHRATTEELNLLQTIADSVSIAMENVSLYSELQSKVKDLQDSNHELGRFAWIASHDLQEPLRTITTQVELLARRYQSQLDARGKGYIDTAIGSARRLQHLVEDLLVHSRVEHSEHFKPIVLTETIREVLRDMHMAIMESGAQVSYDKLPWIWGEQVMIHRLFQNLIHNAIKFRRPGSVPEVHIGCTREEGTWHFTVRDNGIGIEADQSARIFGLFQRVHTQTVYAGSGIGLATCKKIVELHHGRIWVESTPGEGSIFHFVIPLAGGETGEGSYE